MAPTTRFYLARHGRVDDAWRGKVYGDLDVPLAPAGEEQSRRVARLFRRRQLAAVVTSGLARADFAAHAIVRAAAAPAPLLEVEPRLREVHRGSWAGLGRAEIERLEPGAWARWQELEGLVVPAGAETFEELGRRVAAALDEHAARRPGAHVAVVAHKWVVRVALAEALGLAGTRLTRLAVPTSGVVVLDWPADRDGGDTRPRVGEVRVVASGVARLQA